MKKITKTICLTPLANDYVITEAKKENRTTSAYLSLLIKKFLNN